MSVSAGSVGASGSCASTSAKGSVGLVMQGSVVARQAGLGLFHGSLVSVEQVFRLLFPSRVVAFGDVLAVVEYCVG